MESTQATTACPPSRDYYAQNQAVQPGAYGQKDSVPMAVPQQSLSNEVYALQNQFISFVEQTTAEVNSLKQRVAWLESRLG